LLSECLGAQPHDEAYDKEERYRIHFHFSTPLMLRRSRGTGHFTFSFKNSMPGLLSIDTENPF
jgi:hypothetical protein